MCVFERAVRGVANSGEARICTAALSENLRLEVAPVAALNNIMFTHLSHSLTLAVPRMVYLLLSI